MPKVLVTGATGYIASHIILQLLEKNYEVLGTVRSLQSRNVKQLQEGLAKNTSKISKLNLVEIDLLDPYEKWLEVVQGCNFVLHVASPFPIKPPKNDAELVDPARNSTLNILKASTQAGVEKVVLTSSTGAIMYGNGKVGNFDENNWTDFTNLADTTAYYRSKTIAEKAAFDFIQNTSGAVRFSSVQPGFVLGPVLFDSYGTSVGVIKAFLNGEYPAIPKIGYPSVDVRSVANLHILVMESREADGQRFCGVDSYLSFKEMGLILKEAYPNYKIPTTELPNFVVKLLANFDATLKPTLIDLGANRQVSGQKARQILGWQSMDMKQSILDTAQSLFEVGAVSK